MDCLLFVLGQKAVFALDLWCVLLRRGFSFGANGFVHDFFQRRECSVSGARFRALLASLFFSRLHLAAVCWVLLPDSCFSAGQHNFRVGSGRALLESDVERPAAEVRDEIESIAAFYRRYEGHPAAICASRAPRSAPRR